MAQIPTGQRRFIHPGGDQFPSPSVLRVDIAGTRARGVAELGGTIADIGFRQMRANDNAEFERVTIRAQRETSDALAKISTEEQDPVIFEERARKEISSILKKAGRDVNFRNKQRFGTISERIMLGIDRSITTESLKKTVDLSKATFELMKDALVDEMIHGRISPADTVNAGKMKINDLFSNGIISAEEAVDESRKFAVRVVKERFLSTYQQDLQGALKELRESPLITAEEKIDVEYKMSARIAKMEKDLEADIKKEDDRRVKQAFEDLEKGEKSIGEVRSFIEANKDSFTVAEYKMAIKQADGIEDVGGFGNQQITNSLKDAIWETPGEVTMDTIARMRNDRVINSKQADELRDEIRMQESSEGKGRIWNKMFNQINDDHKASGIFGSTLLNEEIMDHLRAVRFEYIRLTEEGMPPMEAYRKANLSIPEIPSIITFEEIDVFSNQIKAVLDKAEKEKRPLTEEEHKRISSIREQLDLLDQMKKITERIKGK